MFEGCKDLNETQSLIKRLEAEHYSTFQKQYTEHRELHASTLLQAKRDYKEGLLPDNTFIKPRCCFNHYFGLTTKRGQDTYLPIFDYELHLVHTLDTRNFITLLASRGLGKTHIIIVRYGNWRILRSNEWDNQDVLLTTGLTQMNSTELLNKIQNMYVDAFPNIELDYAGTELFINKTRLIAFPAENLKKMRLYDRVAAVFVDEADFYNLKDQQRLQEACLGYIAKSKPLIVFFSTPDKVSGFMAKARKKWLEDKKITN